MQKWSATGLQKSSTMDLDSYTHVGQEGTRRKSIKLRMCSVHVAEEPGKMIISLSLNITMNRLGGASVITIFTTRRSHGYVNTTTWLGISQFFLFLAPNFNILTTENRSRCNRDLN